MQCKNRLLGLVAAPLLLALAATATAQDANIKQPIEDLERLACRRTAGDHAR